MARPRLLTAGQSRRNRLIIISQAPDIPDPPAAPSPLTVTNGVGGVTVSAGAVTDATSYTVYRRDTATGTASALATDLTDPSYTDTTAPSNANRYYSMTASNDDGESDESAIVGGHALGAQEHTAAFVIATGTDDGFWYEGGTPSLVNNASDIYFGLRNTNGAHNAFLRFTNNSGRDIPSTATVKAASDMSWVARGTLGTTTCTVRMSVVKTQNAPAPTTYAGAEGATRTTAVADWTVEAFTGTTAYTLPSGVQTALAAALQEYVSNFGIPAGEAFTLYIENNGSSANAHRDINASETANDPTFSLVYDDAGDAVAPGVPTGLAATAGASGITLVWDEQVENDLLGYNVYRATSSGGVYSQINASLVSTSAVYLDNAGLSDATTYYYKVTAVDTSGNESAQSTSANATTIAASTSTVAMAWDDAETHPTFDSIGVYLPFAGDADATATMGPWRLTTSGASAAATSLTTSALPIPLVSGTRIVFQDGATVVTATLSGDEAAGQTSLSVNALAADIPATATAILTGLQFKKSADSDWRFALPPLRVEGTDNGAVVKYFTGSVLACDHGATYDIKATVASSEGVTGDAVDTVQATTRADAEVPDFTSLTPTRYVDPATGSDSNDGTSGTPWATLAKALATNVDAGIDGTRMIVQLAPGTYDGPFTRTGTGDFTLLAEYPAVEYTGAGAHPDSSHWAAINAANRTIIVPPAALRSAPGEGKWTLLTGGTALTGPGLNGAASTTYSNVYKWNGASNTRITFMSVCADETSVMTDVPRWKTEASGSLSTAAGWIELMTTNLNWNVPDNDGFGFWRSSTGEIYLRLQDDVDPNTLYVTMGLTGTGALGGLQVADDMHVYGVQFRGWEAGVKITTQTGAIVSHCLFDGGRWGVYEKGTDNGASAADVYASDTLIDTCMFRQTSRARTGTGDDSAIEWNVIKQPIYRANGTVTTNRICGDFESTAVYGDGSGRRRVVRHCHISGFFNGLAKGQNNGLDRWAGAYNDFHTNYVEYATDEAFEPELQSVEGRFWNNRAEHCSCFAGLAPITWGNLYFWRNTGWQLGNHVSTPPNAAAIALGERHEPGPTIGKYDAGSSPRGAIHFYHNTIWSDRDTSDGTSSAGFQGPAQLGGGGNFPPLWWVASNIWRVPGKPFSITTGAYSVAETWHEDYNVIVSGQSAATGITSIIDFSLDGTSNTTIGAYRTQLDSGLDGWEGDHTNVLGGGDVAITGHSTVDGLFTDTATGNLTLAAAVDAIDAGMAVPNISDIGFSGDAPDLGAYES